MFATVRAKLTGLSFVSLCFILLVGAAGYYEKSVLSDSIAYTQRNLETMNNQMRLDLALEQVHADVLQVLHDAKTGDTARYKDALTNLDGHLKILNDYPVKSISSAMSAEKAQQPAAALRPDIADFAKSAQGIALKALTDPAAAEAQFGEFDEKLKRLKADQSAVAAQIAAGMEGSQQAVNDESRGASNAYIAVVAAALVLTALSAYFITRGIMSPLRQLLSGIEKVEGGAFEGRLNLRTRDEFAAVGRAFDKLLDDR
ncbi:MAG: HAMP domain-containing protein, partial [Gallionella sp.]